MGKLSPAQIRFLATVRATGAAGWRCPFTGGRDAGRVASAWHRTADSLAARGFVKLERSGDSKRAFLVRDLLNADSKGARHAL